MAAGVILEFDERVDASHYHAVNKELGLDPVAKTGDWPAGLLSHCGGPTDGGGFAVVEVWESQEAQGEWMEGRLGAALQEVGVPAPSRVTWVDLLAYWTP